MMRARIALVLAVLAVVAVVWFQARREEPGQAALDPGGVAPPPDAPGPSPGGERTPPPPAGRDGTLVGRVVDVEGAPWVELLVACGEHTTRTGTDGSFTLEGLARAALALDLTVSFDPAEPLGVRRLACALPPLAVDLGPQAQLDVGTQVVPRSRPFWIEGQVVLDEAWAASEALTLREVRLSVGAARPEDLGNLYQGDPSTRPGGPIDWSRPPWSAELPALPAVGPDGRFRFAVETPHDPFLFVVQARRFEPFERLILPEPGGSFRETFEMP
ncbi:MAG TPA: hypothetical protein VF530_07230 [Planctomycetota bacterium]